jgi:hypothetical protein
MVFNKFQSLGHIEILESRIAPAVIIPPAGNVGKHVVVATANTPLLLTAGETLSTSGGNDPISGNGNGTYLLYVESGTALVFNTDLNKNGQVDPNEITGIAAGNGLELISFVDIHGDIVTNLTSAGTLSDSDGNASNNNPLLGGDGRVLLNSTIDLIEMRSITASDLYGSQTDTQVLNHLAPSSYSIFGSIYAGKSFGTTDGLNGLIIDTTGTTLQAQAFTIAASYYSYQASTPVIGSIHTGTAASGENFSFGVSSLGSLNVSGSIVKFIPPTGQIGGDINGVTSVGNVAFNLDGLYAGNGGFGARGGNIVNITLGGDTAGGYTISAGDGGDGFTGGQGGSIINFSDLNSNTSTVTISSGNGGIGLTGFGGNGGTATFGTMNIFGDVSIHLGSGGDGFKGGGNGADLKSLNFTTPSSTTAGSGLFVVSTWRDPYTAGDNLGRTLPIDFNGDGVGDFVFSGQNPSELVAELSNGSGGFTRVNLNIAGTPGNVTVGDFNGDGHPDIAVAFSDAGGNEGVEIILSKWSASGSFVGFTSGHYNPLPSLLSYGYEVTGQPITQLVSGDFNHDGLTDIALTAVYTTAVTGVLTDVLMVMQGDGTGNVYANFGIVPTTSPNYDPNLALYYNPVLTLGTHSAAAPIELQSAGLGASDTDVLFYGVVGKKVIHVVDYASNGFNSVSLLDTAISLGQVDTNRKLPAGTTDNYSPTDATFANFTVGDMNADGFTDIAVLTKAPAGYLVIFTGDGIAADYANGLAKASGTGQQAGIHLVANDGTVAPIHNTDFTPTALSITSGDIGGSEIAVYGTQTIGDYTHGIVYTLSLAEEDYGGTPNVTPLLNGATVVNGGLDLGETANQNTTIFAPFDTYRPDATSDPSTTIQFVALIDANANTFHAAEVTVTDAVSRFQQILDLSPTPNLTVTTGNGGNSTIGAGGAGGSIGGAALGTVIINGSGFALSPNSLTVASFSGFFLTAGDGGSGFLKGGAGGVITGLQIAYDTDVPTNVYLEASLTSGSGGDSIKSSGGAGGTISNNNINGGSVEFLAGDGGSGHSGGNGGAVIGSGSATLPDAYTYSITVSSGVGGNGISAGGAGGNILNFSTQLLVSIGGIFSYTAGAGGDASAGTGGSGGGILNSSPLADSNGFGGTMYLQAGDGGSGLTGGAGGSIAKFNNNPTQIVLPTLLTALAGNGGAGVTGNGGNGGNISSLQGSGTAYANHSSQADLILAGNGGSSFGGRGGKGGSIIDAVISAGGGGIVTAAGAGGDGLKAGGSGGSVIGTTANAPAPQTASSKVLVVAGAGGNAYASSASTLLAQGFASDAISASVLAFGNTNGVGGTGGSINGFVQTGSVVTSVDLIAGNGGSTINFGTSSPLEKLYVGVGGSISNVNIQGTIGNTDPAAAILAYGTSSSQYGDPAAFLSGIHDVAVAYGQDPLFNPAPQLSDADGNVGLVAGAAGRVKGDLPAAQGINGSVNNLTARAIMSMVAGSVDRIASVQSAQNISISLNNGDLGTDKNYLGSQGTYDYLDGNGNYIVNPLGNQNITGPVLNGALIDGAIVTKNPITGISGSRVFVLS